MYTLHVQHHGCRHGTFFIMVTIPRQQDGESLMDLVPGTLPLVFGVLFASAVWCVIGAWPAKACGRLASQRALQVVFACSDNKLSRFFIQFRQDCAVCAHLPDIIMHSGTACLRSTQYLLCLVCTCCLMVLWASAYIWVV